MMFFTRIYRFSAGARRCAGAGLTAGSRAWPLLAGALLLSRSDRVGVSAAPRRRRHLGARNARARAPVQPKARAWRIRRASSSRSFPEVTSRRPARWAGPTMARTTTGFFNTEYFVDLKPKEEWRPVFDQDKEKLIARHGPGAGQDSRRDLELLAAHLRQHGRSGQRRQRANWRSRSMGRSEDARRQGR